MYNRPITSGSTDSRGQRVRVAHVCSSDLAIPALMPFCKPLVARGWEITMITPDGPNVPMAAEHGLVWLPLTLQRRIHVASDITGSLRLARQLRGQRYDIVHTHNIKVGHIARVVATAMRAPIVVHTVHGMAYSLDTPIVKRTAHALLEMIASAACDLVLTQSTEDRDTLLATHSTPARKLVVIGNGINLSRFDPAVTGPLRKPAREALGLADDDILFVSAGRLIVEKGFLELFEAAAIARKTDPRIRVAVAGPIDDQRVDALDAAALDRARAAGVLLLGKRSDMPAIYAASDVVTLPSWHEGMPRVLMEGAAMGKPLLATNVVGCREIVRPPRNGYLVPVRDASALAKAMIELAADHTLRQRLGRDNAVQAREEYDIERSVAAVNAEYDRLLGAR